MKYEVILSLGKHCISSWRFKSINQVVRYLHECDLEVISADVFRLTDLHHFDTYELLEVFYG